MSVLVALAGLSAWAGIGLLRLAWWAWAFNAASRRMGSAVMFDRSRPEVPAMILRACLMGPFQFLAMVDPNG